MEVTDQTDFTITEPGKCSPAPALVSCTASEVGDYTVTGTLDQPNRASSGRRHPTGDRPGGQPGAEASRGDDRLGDCQPYTVEGTTADGRPVKVTDQTVLSITAPQVRQAPGTVSCTPAEVGDHTVTATLDQPNRDQLRATATLTGDRPGGQPGAQAGRGDDPC